MADWPKGLVVKTYPLAQCLKLCETEDMFLGAINWRKDHGYHSDIHIPATDGQALIMPRHTKPEKADICSWSSRT